MAVQTTVRWTIGVLLVGVSCAVRAEAAPTEDLACNQQPGSRFFWVERGFCDLEVIGPERAQGIVIWNHGLSGTRVAWNSPVPPAVRLLQMRGWDVIAIKRHNLAEGDSNRSLYRSVERTLDEARRRREEGYRKVVLAGQSFGGYITLEAAASAREIFAAVAMAPGVTPSPSYGRLDTSLTERDLQATKAERVALVYPKNDALFGNIVRGEAASRILTERHLPYFVVDETSDITGHGGGTTGKFALQYGLCLSAFLSAPTLPVGRFTCPPSDEGQALRELLVPPNLPALVLEPEQAPAAVTGLAGRWYGFLGDTVVMFALVAGSPPRVLYRAASSAISGGIREAVVGDGTVSATLSNRARIVVRPGPAGPTPTWTPADGGNSLTTTLKAVRD